MKVPFQARILGRHPLLLSKLTKSVIQVPASYWNGGRQVRHLGLLSSMSKGISKFFGKTEPDVSKNQFIDKSPGLPYLIQYGILPLMKAIFGIFQKSVLEMEQTQQALVRQVTFSLEQDPNVVGLLGNDIRCVNILSSQSSSMNINGKKSSRQHLIMMVQGTKASGSVEVIAESKMSEDLTVTMCRLNAGGMMLNVPVQSKSNVIIDV